MKYALLVLILGITGCSPTVKVGQCQYIVAGDAYLLVTSIDDKDVHGTLLEEGIAVRAPKGMIEQAIKEGKIKIVPCPGASK